MSTLLASTLIRSKDTCSRTPTFCPRASSLKTFQEKWSSATRTCLPTARESARQELGFTEQQIITLASIVEKEAKVDAERKLISAVYHNRLKQGMKLQADPTAVYGTKAWITKVTKEDLKRRSPYNTYLHKGLPPGPIANPGEGAILAALYPAENVDYLFFVAQGDGSHFFSKDFGAHEKAIGRYRLNRKKAAGGTIKSRRSGDAVGSWKVGQSTRLIVKHDGVS